MTDEFIYRRAARKLKSIDRRAHADHDDRRRRIDERIREVIACIPGVSYGYIGNLDSRWGDDRAWYLFVPGAGADIGGYATEDRDKLLSAAAALKVGYELAQ